MSNQVLNTLILSAFLAVAVGGGYYVTKRVQPAEIDAIEADIEAIENRDAEVESLLLQETAASEEAAATLARWNARYKVLPSSLSSADVVAYLNALSARGFHRFDLSLVGVTPGAAASSYTYQVTGEAYFESLFGFLWHLENSRALYKVRDLSIDKSVVTVGATEESYGREASPGRETVLASFSMTVDAFFSSDRDVSAPEGAVEPPPEAFPARRVAVNPFFPFVLDALPANVDDLVEVGADALVSVVGGAAVFERGGELRQLRAGDRVYLGRIANVDPQEARVTVDLNRGGVRDRVTLELETEPRYRQFFDRAPPRLGEVVPGPTLDEAPPAPGTPEADAAGLYPASSPARSSPSQERVGVSTGEAEMLRRLRGGAAPAPSQSSRGRTVDELNEMIRQSGGARR
ncbi:hypothetical protein RQM47_13850 [Rubrivirga sp. S365]|uniref:Uncharacterized protein n=1 Tax=Rubrivirga litoralis TaxID=3075598 RepID=A0ABU3BMM9_9BACT|nr:MULTISPECIES: hypothetical protein [unclassified Rubrivirga]MDT0630557.1 hypothetical protein [Rubrivirga sp. F394]MDT7857731.1 hypothetical protein [Rubrivirga sp. S365]